MQNVYDTMWREKKSEYKIIFIQWSEICKNSYAGGQGLCNNKTVVLDILIPYPPSTWQPQKIIEFFIVLFSITAAFKIVI